MEILFGIHCNIRTGWSTNGTDDITPDGPFPNEAVH